MDFKRKVGKKMEKEKGANISTLFYLIYLFFGCVN